MSLISNFYSKQFNNFINDTCSIITSYVEKESVKPVIQTVWRNIWSESEAQHYVDSLLEKKIIAFDAYDTEDSQSFIQLVRPLFVEMAKSAYERKFLIELSEAVEKQKVTIKVKKGIPSNCLISIFGPAGSCALELPEQSQYVPRLATFAVIPKKYFVKLCLKEEVYTLMKDTKGEIHIDRLSNQRILFHELVHIFHSATERQTKFVALPKTDRWTNGNEMMTIRGHENEKKLKEEYSENGYALTKNEMERMTHKEIPYYSLLTKEQKLLTALSMGAYGTVDQLLNEWLEWDMTEKDFIFIQKKACTELEYYALKLTGFIEHAVTTIRKEMHLQQPFNISKISAVEIVDCLEKPIGFSEPEDPNFYEQLLTQRKKAYSNIIAHCIELDQGKFVEKVEYLNEKRGKEIEEIQAELIPILKVLQEAENIFKEEGKK